MQGVWSRGVIGSGWAALCAYGMRETQRLGVGEAAVARNGPSQCIFFRTVEVHDCSMRLRGEWVLAEELYVHWTGLQSILS
ncbi:hypothetical protein AC579_9211 [Pseudocercospora musae]|uniref:Uncharacterized protein n=1 Tax=Pseudocercospora musae TaxID=113226 RepID=A0A139I0F8_9PEZI|nr:hypothetical protein AC579_9211 [Pseudocercospora musae]